MEGVIQLLDYKVRKLYAMVDDLKKVPIIADKDGMCAWMLEQRLGQKHMVYAWVGTAGEYLRGERRLRVKCVCLCGQ